MTTLELHPNQTLRDHVQVLRRMRRDGILLSARQSPAGDASTFGPTEHVEMGDFVEFVPLGERRWLVAVVDAKARGPKGAAIARDVARHFAARAHTTRHLGDLLSTANDLVFDAAGGEELVSAAVFILDGARRTIRLANAGQVAPLAVGRSGGVVALEGHGPALGLLPDQPYRDAGPLRLAPGMVVLTVSDGVHDAVDGEGHALSRAGISRALAASRELGPRAVVRRVLADVAEHAIAAEADDRTAVAFSFRGA